MQTKAYLQITMKIPSQNRAAAKKVYESYKNEFLNTIKGATSKELLLRDEDVQVLHGFLSEDLAKAYLDTKLFTQDVATKALWSKNPNIKIYAIA